MCWGKQTLKLPSPTAVRDSQTADALDPEPVKFGGFSDWQKSSRDKGVSALKVAKPDEDISDTLKKRRSVGVNNNF